MTNSIQANFFNQITLIFSFVKFSHVMALKSHMFNELNTHVDIVAFDGIRAMINDEK